MRKQSPGLDWQEIRLRLAEAAGAVESGQEPDPEERQRILAARARELAREPAAEQPGAGIEVVEFQLARERYGVELSLIAEVLPLREYTVVPCAPAVVLGIVNVRGRIVSVLDLKKLFELQARGLTELNRVIVLRSEAMELGVLADAIHGLRQVRLEELQTGLATPTGIREKYLQGVTGDGLIILAADRMLSDPGLAVREEVA